MVVQTAFGGFMTGINCTEKIDENIAVACKMIRHSLEVMNDFLNVGKIPEATQFALQATWGLRELEALMLARQTRALMLNHDGVIPPTLERPNL